MRLIIVSNRLPIVVVEEKDKFSFTESAGGLVSGLSAYLNSLKGSSFIKSDYVWLGWPGSAVSDKFKKELKSEALTKYNAFPVFLSEEDMDKFYLGFCNKTIWPLFHYFPSYVVYDEDYWKQYKLINETFCHTVLEIIKPDDTVWIQDYHLMLLPRLLREKMPDLAIGYFHHIPFPSFEIFRLLPGNWRSEILEGLLGADLLGFHIHEYTQHFLRCVLRILGYEHDMGLINSGGHIAKAETFPMGIDFQKYNSAAGIQEIAQEKEGLKKTLKEYKVILSIDRLDYSKGVTNRLRGFEVFLERNPNWLRKLIFVLVLVPSRIGVDRYQEMKKQIDEQVGRINGRFGDIEWTPIVYQYKYLPFGSLLALYGVSDICLVTPLRDGMNLVAKEYIAARTDQTGVLILSEMAGAEKELGEAIIINPNNIEEYVSALQEAVEMPAKDQIWRNQIMQNRLRRYDVVRWANDFITELNTMKKEQKERFYIKVMDATLKSKLINDFKNAHRKIIFLDYDGTLLPFTGLPQLAKPPREIMEMLTRFAEKPNTDIIIISGRNRNTLQDWLGEIGLGLVAEHGVWIKEKNDDWKLIKPLMNEWKTKIIPILELYADRLPGSFVEEKEFSLAWHYRKADPELSSVRAKELIDQLVEFTANIDVQILCGNKVIEVRNAGVNKGVAAMHFLSKDNYDFILAIGDDNTDEDLFKAVQPDAYTFRVGIVPSYARFNLRNYMEVRTLIEGLIP